MKYRCVKPFSVDKFDGDGFRTEKQMRVRNDSIWEKDKEAYRLVGDDETIRLESKYGWLEITEEIFNEHFVEEKDC